jgi:hypothetical protein
MVGGNPMAASMQLFAGLTGANTMGNFGKMHSITARETEQVMQKMAENFYTQQNYEGPGGVQEDMRIGMRNRLKKYAGTATGRSYLNDLNVDPNDIDNLDMTAGSGSAAETAIKARIAAKQVKSADMSRSLETFLSSENGEIQNTLQDALKDQIKEILDETKGDIKEYLTPDGKNLDSGKVRAAIKEGKLDISRLRGGMAKIANLDELEKDYLRSVEYQQAGGRLTGFDFAKSRGFKIEDLTSGFARAAEFRMLGNNKNRGIAESMGEFGANAGGALSAARSVFGNLSGDQLVTKISDLIGTDAADLSSKSGSAEIEKLLRDVKSTSRVAGLSIKTMLSIIESTKQLAASNPQLQHMSGGAATSMAIKAVTTAADMGMTMNNADYRRAGGAPGLAARKIEESQAFMSSPLGSAGAAILARAKGTSAYGKIKEMFEQGGLTGRALDSGGIRKIANLLGVSVNEVTSVMSNTLLQQDALQDKDINETLMNAEGASVTQSFFGGLKAFGKGASQAELERKYKESAARGETFEDFSNREIKKYLVTPQAQQLWRSHKLAIQKHFIDSLRTPEEKKRMQELIASQTKEDTELSKEMDAKQAPIITQVLDAFMKGTKTNGFDMDAAISGFTKIFAVDDKQGKEAQEAALKAQGASKDLLTMMSDTQKASDDLQEGKVTSALNAFTRGRRQNALARGENIAEGEYEDVTDSEVLEISRSFKSLGVKTAAEARQKLVDMRKAKSEGKLTNEAQFRQLRALESANKMELLKTDSSVAMLNSDKGVKGVMAASVRSATDESVEDSLNKKKIKVYGDVGAQLETAGQQKQGADDIHAAEAWYRKQYGQKFNYAQILRDYERKEGFFKTAEYKSKYAEKGALKSILDQGTEKLKEEEQKQQALGEGSTPENQTQRDLVDALKSLITTLTDGGGIGTALGNLATALTK